MMIPVPIVEIARTVAALHRLTLTDLVGPVRQPRLVAARHEAWLLAQLQGHSLADIGRAMQRDQTSVARGIRRCRHRFRTMARHAR